MAESKRDLIAKPILLAVNDQVPELETIQRELLKRYAAVYEAIADSPGGMKRNLRRLSEGYLLSQ